MGRGRRDEQKLPQKRSYRWLEDRKKCSASLTIREMQIKTGEISPRFRETVAHNIDYRDMRERTPHLLLVGMLTGPIFLENSMFNFSVSRNWSPLYSSNSTSGHLPQGPKGSSEKTFATSYVHRNTIYNSPNLGTAPVSKCPRLDEENGILQVQFSTACCCSVAREPFRPTEVRRATDTECTPS